MNKSYGQKGGDCVNCGVSTTALRSEVEVLKRRLLDRDVAIVQLEAQMAQDRPEHFPQGQVAVLRAQCDHWQDKYDRLLEAHKRLQKVNQGLEDKLLRLVDRTESEKSSLAADTASLTTALTTAAQAINRLKQENERYKNDLNVAIQLLQCNPSKYATHKLDSLPSDLQKKAKLKLAKEPKELPKPEMKVIKVPIPTFPPTAMVYSVNRYAEENTKEEPVDAVSAAIMAAVLEERQRERAKRHCSTCSCSSSKGESSVGEPEENTELNGNGDDVDSKFQNREGSKFNRKIGFKVNVVDVGTQMLPSYIGESGKVQSTCIYCQSSKNVSSEKLLSVDRFGCKALNLLQHTRSKGQPVNQINTSIDDEDTSKLAEPSSPDSELRNPSAKAYSYGVHSGSAWDWAAESHDSGTPSTPSSLISASLSYESETSNVTSPQDSPGRVSLTSARLQPSKTTCLVSSPDSPRSSQAFDSNANIAQQNPSLEGNYVTRPITPLNSRSHCHETLTPPIHRSPPRPRTSGDYAVSRSSTSSPDVVVSSTATASNTETTL
ncbi:Golgi organization [Halocaridina rubra]|uniref:Golgi organization n=1 Tax=Halocaridina rubra TaxID=373956 RepID=A0AAN8WWS6_HALRR